MKLFLVPKVEQIDELDFISKGTNSPEEAILFSVGEEEFDLPHDRQIFFYGAVNQNGNPVRSSPFLHAILTPNEIFSPRRRINNHLFYSQSYSHKSNSSDLHNFNWTKFNILSLCN